MSAGTTNGSPASTSRSTPPRAPSSSPRKASTGEACTWDACAPRRRLTTNPSAGIFSVLDAVLVPANRAFFPTAPPGAALHTGFQANFEHSADTILAAVLDTLARTSARKVLVTGHSLGGVLAMLDAVYLRSKLPRDIDVRAVAFAIPRMGNQEWTDFVSAEVCTDPSASLPG